VSLTVVPELPPDDHDGAVAGSSASLIDQIVREGARKMLAAALQAEVDACIAAFADECDERGRRLVVRNGYHAEREVLTAAGAVAVKAPRVNDKRIDETTGERRRFSSAILPAWCRKSPQVTGGLASPARRRPAGRLRDRTEGRVAGAPVLHHDETPARFVR
jgi:Transposase, Mutator family